jgi:hypothetical protein
MKKSKYFSLEELIPPEVFKAEGEKAWAHLQDDLIDLLDGVHDFLHEKFDTPGETIVITINDWLWVKQNPLTESGFRVSNTTTGAPQSQHKKGGAVDIKVRRIFADRIQKAIIASQDDPRLAKITRMEKNPPTSSWTHLDIEKLPSSMKRIHVFIP